MAKAVVQSSMADSDQYSEAETKRRMEDALRRALSRPHKPLDKFKGKTAAARKRKRKPARKRA
jgi:hypothetical protein